VVLDFAGDTGVLILHTEADLDGYEIEVSRPGDARRTHSQVRQRRVGSKVRYAAVYPGLAAGSYTLWRDEVTPTATFTIASGQITNLRWPASTVISSGPGA
jgi:hypothetical protein